MANALADVTFTYVTEYGQAPSDVVRTMGAEAGWYQFTAEDLPTLHANDATFVGWRINGEQVNVGDIWEEGQNYASAVTLTLTAEWQENKKLKTRIIHKHDTAENWAKAANFAPMNGELIVYEADEEYDYARLKVGDGATNVNVLPFLYEFISLEAIDELCGNTAINSTVDTGVLGQMILGNGG